MNIENIIKNNIVMDNAFGFEPEIEVENKWEVLDRFYTAGFSYMTLSVATDMTNLHDTLHYLSKTTEHIEQHPEKYLFVKNYEDILRARKENKLGLGYMFQGTHPLASDLRMLKIYRELGVRSMILCYNTRNEFGDGCAELSDAGLSFFGKECISKMNEVGILIDLSHSGYKTSLDVMTHSTSPVIFSHSNVYEIHPHPRNLRDDQIMACAEKGGFIGINGNGPLLGDNNASVQKYVDHVDYIIKLVGDDHVGLGTDLVYFPEIFDEFMKKNRRVYPENYAISSIAQWKSIQPEQLTAILEELARRGYQEKTLCKLLGGNYLRVIKNM